MLRPGIEIDHQARFLSDPDDPGVVEAYIGKLQIDADNARQFGRIATLNELEMKIQAVAAFLPENDPRNPHYVASEVGDS